MQQINSKKVNVLGDANVDMILNLSDKTKISDPKLFSGGSSANVATGLAKLGIPVSFFGSLGNDIYGKHVINDMKSDGIDIANVELSDEFNTAMVIGVVEENSERHFFIWPPKDGAHNNYILDQKSKNSLLDCDWLHVSGISLRFKPIQETMLEAMEICKENNKTISFDLNLRIELWGLDEGFKETVLQAISYSTYILGNLDEEFKVLFNTEEDMLSQNFDSDQVIVCRKNDKGAIGISNNVKVFSKAFPIKPIDSVGAGDAFNSGFIYSTLIGNDLQKSIEIGNLVAAYKLLGSGARHLPNNEELVKFSNEFR